MNFGMPYMGSKSAHVEWLLKNLPSAENFYDLFGGGGAVSHAAVLSKKYKNIFYNEIKSDVAQLFSDAISGKFNPKTFKPEWISRERFQKEKESNAYIRCIWSFGNNQKTYLFGEKIESKKRSLHQAVVFNEFDPFARSFFGFSKFPENLTLFQKRIIAKNAAKKRNLKELEQLERLEISSKSYDEVEIKNDSIIYCDPPYKGTAEYVTEFDHDAFYVWAEKNEHPIFFSEYSAPKHFKLVAQKKVNRKLGKKKEGYLTLACEKLFANKAAQILLEKKGGSHG